MDIDLHCNLRETRLSVCDKVEQSISESIDKAFEGKLLSESEIKGCKQEKDYEPASVLLEKIKAEKLATLREAQGKRILKK